MQQKWNQNFDGEPMTDIPQKFLNAGCDVYMVMQLRHDEKILDERFASIGEIENEQLLTALETLKVEDLEIITMYAYEGYDITEISKVYGVSRPTISIKIKRITKFLKNFNFNATN